jgi:hypothetical protein
VIATSSGSFQIFQYHSYGTLCFASSTPREDPIRDKEKALLEMPGRWVEYTVDIWDGLPIREQNFDAIEKRAVSSSAIDSMMDALRKRTRRVILLTLLDDTTETSLTTLERRLDGESVRSQLFHSDLPKIATDGYIQLDTGTETISKGPKFSEVKPLVQLLKEYHSAFPEKAGLLYPLPTNTH